MHFIVFQVMRAHHFSKGLMASQGASLRVVSTLKPQTDDQVGPHYSTERNGTESVVALFYGTEWNTANMANIHKSNLML